MTSIKIRYEGHWSLQVMYGLLHHFQPVDDIRIPFRIIGLSRVELYPLAVFIDAASPIQVHQVDIIRCEPIVASSTGRYGIGLDLPGNESRIGEIEGNIWIPKLKGWRNAITFVQYPIRMVCFPIGEVMPCREARICPPVAMQRDIIAQENIRIARPICIQMIPLNPPYCIVALRGTTGVGDREVKILKGVDVVPGIN